ncbi:ABC transporter permease [Williamsia sp. SKLECPSW1]
MVGAASTATIGATDLGCSKTGTPGRDGFSCADPITDLVGWWPFVAMGLLLAGPPVIAAVARRVWVSWLVVVCLVAVGVWGVGHWTGEWSTLILGLPLAVLGAAVAVAHTLTRRIGRASAAC